MRRVNLVEEATSEVAPVGVERRLVALGRKLWRHHGGPGVVINDGGHTQEAFHRVDHGDGGVDPHIQFRRSEAAVLQSE